VPGYCDLENGMPSGHSTNICCILGPVWVFLNHDQKTSNFTKYASMVFVLLPLYVMTIASRLYLGLHSYDQLIFGFLQGVILCYLFTSRSSPIYKYLFEFYGRIQAFKISQVVINPVIGLATIMLLLGNFFVEQNKVSFPEEWISNIKLHCAEAFAKKGNPGDAIFRKLMYNCSFFGFYAGACIEIRYMGTYKYPFFAQTSLWVTLKRVLVHLVCAFPFIAFGQLCFSKGVMPPTIMLLYYMGISKWIALKCDLINTAERDLRTNVKMPN